MSVAPSGATKKTQLQLLVEVAQRYLEIGAAQSANGDPDGEVLVLVGKRMDGLAKTCENLVAAYERVSAENQLLREREAVAQSAARDAQDREMAAEQALQSEQSKRAFYLMSLFATTAIVSVSLLLAWYRGPRVEYVGMAVPGLPIMMPLPVPFQVTHSCPAQQAVAPRQPPEKQVGQRTAKSQNDRNPEPNRNRQPRTVLDDPRLTQAQREYYLEARRLGYVLPKLSDYD